MSGYGSEWRDYVPKVKPKRSAGIVRYGPLDHGAPTTVGQPKRSKYGAVPTVVDGVRFASKREAGRYVLLKLEERAGLITNLTLQWPFPISVVGYDGEPVTVATYLCDFWYLRNGQPVIEDVKGGSATKTATYRLKKKLVEALYGIQIVEV